MSLQSAPPRDWVAEPAFRSVGWSPGRVFFVAWAAYSSYRVLHLLLVKMVEPDTTPSAAVRVGLGIFDGALVALCTLGLVALGERLPIEKPDRARNALIHLCVAVFCSIGTLSMLYAAGGIVAPASLPRSLFVFNVLSFTHALFTFLAVTAIVHAIAYQRRFRERELDALRLRTQLTAAQLRSLTAKLHPHFLFNTLNGISDLIFTDPKKADVLVLRLAQLLRASLDSADDEISMRRELELLSAYFDIERMRFGDRLRVTINADRNVYEARVPPFLVQPLAENAIQHGIAPRASGGAVTLRARIDESGADNRLVLELSDDGVGMPDELREGIGLRVTRQRLQALYRGAGALTVRPRAGGGTVATIELPYESVTS